MPTPDEYLEWKRYQRDSVGNTTNLVLNNAQQVNPDVFANDMKLGKAFGISADVAAASRDMLLERLQRSHNQAMLKGSPRTAQWLKNSDNIRLAWDDVENLTWLEYTVGNLGEAVKRPTGKVISQFGAILEGTGQLMHPIRQTPPEIVVRIAQAKTLSPEGVAKLRADIQNQDQVKDTWGQYVLSNVLSGYQTEKQVYEFFHARRLEAENDPVGGIEWASNKLQFAGEHVQDFGDDLFPAYPGLKDGIGQKVGDVIGEVAFEAIIYRLVGPKGAKVINTLKSAGEQTRDERERGGNENDQSKAAIGGVVLEGLDFIPGDKKLKFAFLEKILGKRAGEFLPEIIGEGAKEVLKKGGENFIAQNLSDPQRSLADGMVEAFFTGAGQHALGESTKKLFGLPDSAGEAPKPVISSTMIEDIGQRASESKLRARSPITYRDHVDAITRGGPMETIYVPVSPFDAFNRRFAGKGKVQLENLPGIGKAQVNVARVTGGDVGVRTSTYTTDIAGTEIAPLFHDYGRFDPKAKTPAEIRDLKLKHSEPSTQTNGELEAARIAQEKNKIISEQERQQDIQRQQASSVTPAQSQAVALDATRGVRSAKTGQTREDYSRDNPPAGASSGNQKQPPAVNGASGQAAVAPADGQGGTNSSGATVPAAGGNDTSSRIDRSGASPVSIPPRTASNGDIATERFKAMLQSSTAPAGRLESPSPSPEIFNRQGPAVPTETPWSDRRKTLNRNGR